jgi:hypothetical protein
MESIPSCVLNFLFCIYMNMICTACVLSICSSNFLMIPNFSSFHNFLAKVCLSIISGWKWNNGPMKVLQGKLVRFF